MTMSIQPHQIGSGDHITTTTPTVMETKRRTYKRKDCVDTGTSTVMVIRKKRPHRRKDDANTSTALETKKRAYKRKDHGDADTPTVTEIKKKRPYRRKHCGDADTPTVMEITKKRPYTRKDCGDTNTSAVMETKKRAYKRKDHGDTNTSTVMEMKKRAYKRKDRGDTDTPTDTEIKKKRPYRKKDCVDADTPTVMEIKKKRPYRRKKCLPHDLIMEEILTKLPVPTLLKSVLVSKLWYNAIHNDHKRLTYSHFLQSQKQPDVILSLLNVRVGVAQEKEEASYGCHFFKFATGNYNHEYALKFAKFQRDLTHSHIWELVGYCNGLPCMASVGPYSTAYIILDPNRKDFIYVSSPAIVGKCTSDASIICHGFGFDPSTNEYKLVSIFHNAQKELNVAVYTLGTKSWRNVTPTSTPTSGHDGRPIIKIRAPTGSVKSAIICTTNGSSGGRCLAWKVVTTLGGAGSSGIQHDNRNNVSNEMEMLLSFSLRDEKFQFIQLPAKSTIDEHLLDDYPHLLEFKGSPCIARVAKKSGKGYPHRCRDDHQGSSNNSSSCCCCCCRVHLYVLKDKLKQVWVKEESFDVRIKSTPTWVRNLGPETPEPCCFCFGSSTTTPRTRILSYSDQMLLYWFNGNYLQVYNLRSEKLKVVLAYGQERVILQAKMKEPRHTLYSDDDDTYCSDMDYQLHCHEENFLSLETFIPEGVAGVDADVFDKLDLEKEDHPCSTYVFIYRGSNMFYPSFN